MQTAFADSMAEGGCGLGVATQHTDTRIPGTAVSGHPGHHEAQGGSLAYPLDARSPP